MQPRLGRREVEPRAARPHRRRAFDIEAPAGRAVLGIERVHAGGVGRHIEGAAVVQRRRVDIHEAGGVARQRARPRHVAARRRQAGEVAVGEADVHPVADDQRRRIAADGEAVGRLAVVLPLPLARARVERVDAVLAAGDVERLVRVHRLRRDRPVRAVDPALVARGRIERIERAVVGADVHQPRVGHVQRPPADGAPERPIPPGSMPSRVEKAHSTFADEPMNTRAPSDAADANSCGLYSMSGSCTRWRRQLTCRTSMGATKASRATPGMLAPPHPRPPTTNESAKAAGSALTSPRARRSGSAPRP